MESTKSNIAGAGIAPELLAPESIAVIGASNDISKPGGKILKNLLDGTFTGPVYPVNQKADEIQGLNCYQDVSQLPQSDLAIIAVPAASTPDIVQTLLLKGTKGFIIISAGFGEETEAGKDLEASLSEMINAHGASLIGPNCIGIINRHYQGVFTTPVPTLSPEGCDFVSSSGATAVFIMEAGLLRGLQFNEVISVGNCAQLGVEDILEYWDRSYVEGKSSKIKLIYAETIQDPDRFYKSAASLNAKGCKIAAIKAGVSEAGSRAALSHTGALSSSDAAVRALFRKAGIVYCSSRDELIAVASIFYYKELNGQRIAVITHAGGSAVMLTDALEQGGLEVPEITHPKAAELLTHLHSGSSVKNPIDFLATGTAEQLGLIIDYVDREFDEIDGMCVVFGSPGLFNVDSVYKVLNEKLKTCTKPIYPVLPSLVNAADEIANFLSMGRVNFPDEVMLGKALAVVYKQRANPIPINYPMPRINNAQISQILNEAEPGFLNPDQVRSILDACGIKHAPEKIAYSLHEALQYADEIGFPVVMKVVGPIHKSDVNGVVLNITYPEVVYKEYKRLMKIEGATAVLIQSMKTGVELFIGSNHEERFGNMVYAGLGGIFIEVLKDIQSGLAPLSKVEIFKMIHDLKGYALLEGVRGQDGVNIDDFVEMIQRLSVLVHHYPQIVEMDLNPVLGSPEEVIAVDARIRVE